jgi:hypothetical protein
MTARKAKAEPDTRKTIDEERDPERFRQLDLIGSNKPPRDLADIAADIHRLEQSTIFEIGELLIEAKESCEHGQWLDWLDDEFEMSVSTAGNYMAAVRLKEKYEQVANFPLSSRIIYKLARDIDDPDLPAIIDALAKETKGSSKPISVDDADTVIGIVRARREHGDYPDAALFAMSAVDGHSWATAAIAALKEARPTTDKAAAEIIDTCRLAHGAADAPRDDEEAETDDEEAETDDEEAGDKDADDRDIGDKDAGDKNEAADDDGPTEEEKQIEKLIEHARDCGNEAYNRLVIYREVNIDKVEAVVVAWAEVAKRLRAFVASGEPKTVDYTDPEASAEALKALYAETETPDADDHWIEGDTR